MTQKSTTAGSAVSTGSSTPGTPPTSRPRTSEEMYEAFMEGVRSEFAPLTPAQEQEVETLKADLRAQGLLPK